MKRSKISQFVQETLTLRNIVRSLIKFADDQNSPPSSWFAFLDAKYEGGKKKVPNPNLHTRDKYPEVAVSTAIKDPIYFDRLKKEYQAWLGSQQTAPPEPPKKESPVPEAPSALPKREIEEALDADNILHFEFGYKGGSNPGGVYIGKDGKTRFVKFYNDPTQAYEEHLANRIYEALGVHAPKSTVFDNDGKKAFASDRESGVMLSLIPITPKVAKNFSKGFVADVLTANWDVLGLALDNVLYNNKGTVRVDNGSSFLHRAQGDRKPISLLNKISEWDSFFKHKYGKIVGKAGIYNGDDLADTAIPMIDKVENISKEPGGWSSFVEKYTKGMDSSDKKQIVDMLEARTKLLVQKRDQLKKTNKTARKIAFRWFITERA